MAKAKKGTVKGGRLICPETDNSYAIADLRGDRSDECEIDHSSVKRRRGRNEG